MATEMSKMNDVTMRPVKFGFLLLENFTMMALASAVEPLRMANQLSGQELFTWDLVTHDGQSVRASDGMNIAPDCAARDVDTLDGLFVVGGVNIQNSFGRKEIEWVQSMARKKIIIGGICTGSTLLAQARLLEGYNASAHWECLASLRERYPGIQFNTRLFTIDGDRMTCSGGTAPLDMMLNVISSQHNSSLAGAISEMFVYERMRNEADPQRIPLRHLLHAAQPKLVDIVELMEANIEEPIELDDLASFAGVSRRQLERLFHSYLGCTPSRYYLKLRLGRARQLLKQTTLPVIEVATACGFVSTPHFSRSYRKYMGISPREERMGGWEKTVATPESPELSSAANDNRFGFNVAMPSAMAAAQFEPSFGSVRVGH
ncbi:GlxA family transcriptional regulator [Bacterioplanoides sp.]|uniref:choline metabolism transcriptional regulator GbdR n=1 Tax=Bacterioplanoides sp. TaxID=2066072 RepID=UPI003AFFE401